MDGEAKPTLEESLGAQYDAIQERDKAERTTAAAEVAEPVETPAETTPATAPEGETAEQKADRLRAEDGKFRKPTRIEKREAKAATETKPAKAAPIAGEAAKPGAAAGVPDPATGQTPASPPTKTDQAPSVAGLNPPSSWSGAAKAAFASLPPAVQAAVATREQQVTQGFAQYDGLRQALAPMRQTLEMRGVRPEAYVAQMVQLDAALSNPQTRAATFDYLARTYGYQMPQGQSPNGVNAAPQPGAQLSTDPTIAALQQQNLSIISFLNAQTNAQRAAESQQIQEVQRQATTDVETFRNDPANEFFDLLRDDIRGVYERAAALNQPAPALKDAYDQAVWANTQTRPIMLTRQAQKAEDDRAKAAADAAAKARKAGSGNIRSVGGTAPNRRTGPLDLHAEMAETYDKINAA